MLSLKTLVNVILSMYNGKCDILKSFIHKNTIRDVYQCARLIMLSFPKTVFTKCLKFYMKHYACVKYI